MKIESLLQLDLAKGGWKVALLDTEIRESENLNGRVTLACKLCHPGPAAGNSSLKVPNRSIKNNDGGGGRFQ
jgi:hypothetical protein